MTKHCPYIHTLTFTHQSHATACSDAKYLYTITEFATYFKLIFHRKNYYSWSKGMIQPLSLQHFLIFIVFKPALNPVLSVPSSSCGLYHCSEAGSTSKQAFRALCSPYRQVIVSILALRLTLLRWQRSVGQWWDVGGEEWREESKPQWEASLADLMKWGWDLKRLKNSWPQLDPASSMEKQPLVLHGKVWEPPYGP